MRVTTIVRRTVYAAGYFAMAAAGVCAWRWPSPSLASATGGEAVLIATWNIFLVVGGLLSGAGAAVERWLGEYLGLPLLAPVFAVYGLTVLGSGRDTSRAIASILLAVACMLIARWIDVSDVRRAAVQGATARREGG